MLIGAASLAGIVMNYASLLVAGRALGADAYGTYNRAEGKQWR